MTLKDIKVEFNRREGKREGVETSLQKETDKNDALFEEHGHIERACIIVQEVAQLTQSELEYRLNELVTLCLQSVFEEDMAMNIEFVLRRGRTEADISLKDGQSGELVHPLEAAGHGIADIMAFGLRMVMWNLSKTTRPVLILDEPFRNVNDPTRNLHKKVAKMMHEVSKQLGLQLIVVTLNDELVDVADRVFHVSRVDGVSKVVVR